jgi:hypothetical protein
VLWLFGLGQSGSSPVGCLNAHLINSPVRRASGIVNGVTSWKIDRRPACDLPKALTCAGLACCALSPTAARRGAQEPAPGLPKVLVFGGNGFVGSRVCEEALKTGLGVVSVNRSGAPRHRAPWVDEVTWLQARARSVLPRSVPSVGQGDEAQATAGSFAVAGSAAGL